jgi:hypothetical protein
MSADFAGLDRILVGFYVMYVMSLRACLLLDLVDISGRNGRRLGVDVTVGSRLDHWSLVRRPDRGSSAGSGWDVVDDSVVVGG